MKKYKVGIALGGGGARGFAHLGVVKALQERGIQVGIISGVSAGAIAGAFLASGKTPGEVLEMMKAKSFFKYSRVQFPVEGFFSLEGLRKHLTQSIAVERIEELPLPLYVAATNLNEGKIEYFDEGPLAHLVLASASIPMLFSPVSYQGNSYVDGGVLDALPVAPLLAVCEKVIAVNIMPIHKTDQLNNLRDIAIRSFQLGVNANARNVKTQCDLYIEPLELVDYHILHTRNADKLFEVGYEHVMNMDLSDF